MDNYLRILISVLNWNNYYDTIFCVKSLLPQTYPFYEISIIDNNSSNDSLNILKSEFPQLRVKQAMCNNGYAAGHNINIDYAVKNNFDAVWIVNSDISARINALAELVNAWKLAGDNIFGSITLSSENPDIVDFGGGLVPADSLGELTYNIYKGFEYSQLPKDHVRRVQSVEGSSVFIPVNLIKKYGFMKTDFFMYGEETDYCLRLKKFGINSYIVYNSVIIHKNASSFAKNDLLAKLPLYYRRRNYLRIMKEHYNWSTFKCLKYNNTIISQIKFIVKSILISNYRLNHQDDYFILKGNVHGCFSIKGKRIDPQNFL